MASQGADGQRGEDREDRNVAERGMLQRGEDRNVDLHLLVTPIQRGLSKFTLFQTGNTPFSLFWKHCLNPKKNSYEYA